MCLSTEWELYTSRNSYRERTVEKNSSSIRSFGRNRRFRFMPFLNSRFSYRNFHPLIVLKTPLFSVMNLQYIRKILKIFFVFRLVSGPPAQGLYLFLLSGSLLLSAYV